MRWLLVDAIFGGGTSKQYYKEMTPAVVYIRWHAVAVVVVGPADVEICCVLLR